jgi:ATP-dependent DNA helicase RecQ
VVFSDAALREMATHKPRTQAAFRQIGGVGDVKLERYGEVFVAAIAEHAAQA